MSRYHSPRVWTLDMKREPYWSAYTAMGSPFAYAGPPRYLLSMDVTIDQMQELLRLVEGRHDPYRGYPSFIHHMTTSYVRVTGIEVTEAEARRITQGADPLEVLLGTFPECGYRLVAVPDPLLGGG